MGRRSIKLTKTRSEIRTSGVSSRVESTSPVMSTESAAYSPSSQSKVQDQVLAHRHARLPKNSEFPSKPFRAPPGLERGLIVNVDPLDRSELLFGGGIPGNLPPTIFSTVRQRARTMRVELELSASTPSRRQLRTLCATVPALSMWSTAWLQLGFECQPTATAPSHPTSFLRFLDRVPLSLPLLSRTPLPSLMPPLP